MKGKIKTVIILIVLLTGSLCNIFADVDKDTAGFVREITGSVHIEGKIGRGGIIKDSAIYFNDEVCTDASSYVRIILNDNSSIEIDEDTCVKINPSFSKKRSISLFLGRIALSVSRVLGIGETFEVNTISAVAGVKGTQFSVLSAEDGSVGVIVREGSIAVSSDGETIELQQENGVFREGFNGRLERVKFDKEFDHKKWFLNRALSARHKDIVIDDFKRRLKDINRDGRDLLVLYEGRVREFSGKDEGEMRKNISVFDELWGTLNGVERRVMEAEVADRLMKHYKKRGLVKYISAELDKFYRETKDFREKAVLSLQKNEGLNERIRYFHRQNLAKKIFANLSPDMKKKLIDSYKKFKSMSEEDRASLIKKWQMFRSLPDERKRIIINKYKRFISLPENERSDILSAWEKWQKLSPEQRERIKENYRKFMELSPEKRRALLKKYKKWKSLDPENRDRIIKEHILKPDRGKTPRQKR